MTCILLLFAFGALLNSAFGVTIDKNNSYIRVYPKHPLFGEDIRITCRMVTPDGYFFYRSEPRVYFYNSTENGKADAEEKGDEGIGKLDKNRFSQPTQQGGTRSDTSSVVVIKDFCSFDVGLKISCVNRVHSDTINHNDEDTILSTTLRKAAVPPPVTNVCIGLPRNNLLTCQSLISVTWDEVPISRTERPIESYRVSMNMGDKQIVSMLPSNQTIYRNLEFGGNHEAIQAEIECVSRAGNSSKAKSNSIEIYRPQIVNVTAELINDRSMILVNWAFEEAKSDWLLDICYELSIIHQPLSYHTETTFHTAFCLPSQTTEYILTNTLATNGHIKYVILARESICNQIPDTNNSISTVPFENIPNKHTNTNTTTTTTTNNFWGHFKLLKFSNSHLVYVPIIIILALTILLFICILCCCCCCCCCCCYYCFNRKRARARPDPVHVELGPAPEGELGNPNPLLL